MMQLVTNKTQRRKVFDCKTNTVKQGDLRLRCPPGFRTVDDIPQLNHRMIRVQLLNFTLNPGLRRVFNEYV